MPSKENPFTILFFWVPVGVALSMIILFGALLLIAALIDWIRGKL